MSDIKILVTGKAGKGKSTVAEIIRQALLNVGIQTTLLDDNGIGIVDEQAGVIQATLPQRIGSVSLNSTVEISTVVARR